MGGDPLAPLLRPATADELGGRFVALDVTDEASVRAAAERVAAEGGLDVLINNAGISGGIRPVSEMTAEDVRRVFETNVFGLVRVTGAFLALLERSASPVIVNVSSVGERSILGSRKLSMRSPNSHILGILTP